MSVTVTLRRNEEHGWSPQHLVRGTGRCHSTSARPWTWCFVKPENGGRPARSSWFARRTKRHDRGAISDDPAREHFAPPPKNAALTEHWPTRRHGPRRPAMPCGFRCPGSAQPPAAPPRDDPRRGDFRRGASMGSAPDESSPHRPRRPVERGSVGQRNADPLSKGRLVRGRKARRSGESGRPAGLARTVSTGRNGRSTRPQPEPPWKVGRRVPIVPFPACAGRGAAANDLRIVPASRSPAP